MEGIARREVEILVHATAPSRGQDDARYRALAQACLDFLPTVIHRLEDKTDIGSDADADLKTSSELQGELEHSTLEERESEASYRPDNESKTDSDAQSSISAPRQDLRIELSQNLESPVLSFNSAIDNADSPAWRGRDMRSQKLPVAASRAFQRRDPQGSCKEPLSEIADSQPENNQTIPAFSSPTRILELYLQQNQSSTEHSSSSYGIGGHDLQGAGPSPELPHGMQQSQSPTSEQSEENSASTSGISTSPSPERSPAKHCLHTLRHRKANPPSTQDPAMSAKRKWLESSNDGDASSSASTRLSIENSTVTTRTTQSRKKQRTNGSVDEVTKTKEVASSEATKESTLSTPRFEAKPALAEKSEIHPPPPTTSMGDLTPKMLITPSLEQIAQKMPLAALFRPKEQLRDLRPMERGHWMVRSEKWDLSVRRRCCEFLGNFIERGMGGWGVWCIWEEEWDNIKVYCWGTIVGHIYLLLYMASESKIKETGACWIGGDGQVIIRMPS